MTGDGGVELTLGTYGEGWFDTSDPHGIASKTLDSDVFKKGLSRRF